MSLAEQMDAVPDRSAGTVDRAKAITRQRFPLPVNLMSFGRPATAADAFARIIGTIHGRHR